MYCLRQLHLQATGTHAGARVGAELYMSNRRAGLASHAHDWARPDSVVPRHDTPVTRAGLARGLNVLPRHRTPTVKRVEQGARLAWTRLGPSNQIHRIYQI
jgi:hypothetical protein